MIDYDSEKRFNGQIYKSPLGFYKKSGFEILTDQRLELENISAVKIKWKNERININQTKQEFFV